MKVICPKCQYENQGNSTRLVCARCATIIDVKMDTGAGTDANGRRQTSRLPFAVNQGNGQTEAPPSYGSSPLPPPRDHYATRIGDDFDDVLDIPRPRPVDYQTNLESSSLLDDVFDTTGGTSGPAYDYSSLDNPGDRTGDRPGDRTGTTPINAYQRGQSRQRETQDYIAAPEPEFMGWPVLPENAGIEDDDEAGFPASRGGLILRIVLGVAVFAGLIGGAYFFLGDLISKRKDQAENIFVGNNGGENAAVGGGTPTVARPPAETASNPPVVMPKPPNQNNPADGKASAPPAKTESKPVDIPPMTGRAGHSELSKTVTAPVSAPAAAPASAPVPSIPTKGNWTIQVASFSDQAQANDRVTRLKAAGVDARVIRADIPGKGTWYRVQIGGFGSREDGMKAGNQLRSRGTIQDFIVTGVNK